MWLHRRALISIIFSLIATVTIGYFYITYDFDAQIKESATGRSDFVENCGAIELGKLLRRHDPLSVGCVNYIVQTKDGCNCLPKMICFDPEKEKLYLGFFEAEILIDEELGHTWTSSPTFVTATHNSTY